MKKRLTTLCATLICLFAFNASMQATTYYASPTGGGNGSSHATPTTWAQALNDLQAGDSLYLLEGVYSFTDRQEIQASKSGSASQLTFIGAYPGEKPILDFRQEPYGSEVTGSNNNGIHVNSDVTYLHVKGLTIRYAGKNGLINYGSYNLFENLDVYGCGDTGIQMKNGGNNTILNCDSHDNFDYKLDKSGELTACDFGGNADGFADKQFTGAGNHYIGCRAWNNSDDGWDFFQRVSTSQTVMENCICYMNGPASYNMNNHPRYTVDQTWFDQFANGRWVIDADGYDVYVTMAAYPNMGNGNGFKLGGANTAHNALVHHCLAVGNTVKGFDQNNDAGTIYLYNNTAYYNHPDYGFANNSYGCQLYVRNCISYMSQADNRFTPAVANEYNSWNLNSTIGAGDFQSLDTTLILSPRNADGSLAEHAFMRLTDGSLLVDAGVDVGLPYNGSAPDLGCYESNVTPEPEPEPEPEPTQDYSGGLPGSFSINAHGDQVRFAQGNLQYLAASNIWRFALNQYDYSGNKNAYISATYTDWIDLFGWGTSGYDNTANDPCAINYQPYSSTMDSTDCLSTNITGYGPSIDQEYRGLIRSMQNYDWGVYNTISNSAEDAAWRTLSYGEWYYILNGRPNAANLRSQATISGTHGYILLPDNWEIPAGLTFVPQTNNWVTNTYTTAQWTNMEAAGAVFLPAAGQRRATQMGHRNAHGYYWTSDAGNVRQAQVIHFDDTIMFNNSRYTRCYGNSVRLVRDINRKTDPDAKFEGFDLRGSHMGTWIYNNGGFQNPVNLTINETDTVFHKYTLILTTGGQESSFTLGGVRFSYTNSGSNKVTFKTTNGEIHPDGKGRKITIPTYPGDEILISVADETDYLGLRVQGIDSAYVDLMAGDNILQATGDAIVITTSNAGGDAVKVQINAILCIAHHLEPTGLIQPDASQKAVKIFRNGQLFIRRGEKVYTITGQKVK